MSLVKAEEDLKKKGMLDRVIHLAASTATVAEAAEALGVEPGMIAKTLSFLQEEKPVLILTEGTAKIDNRKYKDTFHIKAKMIPFEEVETQVGHAPGGVCPFGINENVIVYLDESRGHSVVRTFIYLPAMISGLIMGYIIYFFVMYNHGVFNEIIGWFGAAPVDWMADGPRGVIIMTLINSWQFVGICMVIYK